MGYNSRVSGEIVIDPPLTWSEYKESPYLTPGSPNWPCVILRQHEDPRDAEGGVMLVRWADAIVPATDESGRMYGIEEQVRKIVAAYREGHTFSGYLEIDGENQGDLWRLVIKDGTVIRFDAKFVWPDGADGA